MNKKRENILCILTILAMGIFIYLFDRWDMRPYPLVDTPESRARTAALQQEWEVEWAHFNAGIAIQQFCANVREDLRKQRITIEGAVPVKGERP